MSFVEGVHPYQNHTVSNNQALAQTRESAAARPLSAQAQELVPGKVFEGTITEIKNGQVTIGLNDGRSISARMEAGVHLEKGQPMLFEIKSASGEQIAIRPVTLESAQNPTLLRALEAAGLQVNDKNLSMVNQMMAQQLPVDKSSLHQMMRLLANFPKANVQTLLQMQKLGLVITEDSLNQFQNYKNGEQAILPELNRLMEGIAELSGKMFASQGGAAGQGPGMMGNLLGIQQQIAAILSGSSQQQPSAAQTGALQNQTAMGQLAQNQVLQNLSVANVDAAQGVIIHEDLTQGNSSQPDFSGNAMGGNAMGEGLAGGSQMQSGLSEGNLAQDGLSAGNTAANERQEGTSAANTNLNPAQEGMTQAKHTPPVELFLNKEQQGRLTALLQEFSGARENERLLPQGTLNTDLSAGELLEQMMSAMEQSEDYTSASMQKLFYSDEYKEVLKQAMADQWTLTPERLKEEGAVKEMYQRLTRQMADLQQVLTQAGKEGTALAKTAQSVQSNLDFMNQLNQVYTYVQLPLKLQNQNAHSDLYVYTNKKNLREKEGALTALLHLDLEHLGSTDIFVKLEGAAVETEFYFEDEMSCRLISGYADQLMERLEQKGYSCEVKVENRRKKQDFVEDFLEREKPPAKLHRYSFDVKA
ncbi:MAG: flagellar hook-length control protein FliK [Lachnospiraceae bacterium]|nr:flagellar hook-length control protein FliK [Lachnospiraceae bacterium]